MAGFIPQTIGVIALELSFRNFRRRRERGPALDNFAVGEPPEDEAAELDLPAAGSFRGRPELDFGLAQKRHKNLENSRNDSGYWRRVKGIELYVQTFKKHNILDISRL